MRKTNLSNVPAVRLIGILLIIFPLMMSCHRARHRPNIVVLLVDALRADHLPFYGYAENTAPFLHSLSGQSAVFTNAFAASNWTVEATASLFTSIYPFQRKTGSERPSSSGAGTSHKRYEVNAFVESVPTIAEVMKKNGYRTYGISSNLFITDTCGYALGFDRFHFFRMKADAETLNQQIRTWRKEMDASPYFLYVHYTDTHVPYDKRHPFYRPQKTRKKDFVARYDSNIHYFDQELRKLFTEMRWDRNTIFIITADHGEEFWEHGYRGHGKNLFNGSVRIPLFVYYPKFTRKGRVISQNVSAIDIIPTVCDLIGRPSPHQAEGVSLFPAIRGDAKYLEDRPIFLFVDRGKFKFKGVVRDGWKWIMDQNLGKHLLFDLKKDPKERINLAAKKEYAGIRAGLMEQFLAFERKCRKYAVKKTGFELTPERTKELETFGYLN